MKNIDWKYVLKRVVTFFLIFIILSLLKCCKVHAASSYWYDSVEMNKGFSEAYYYDFTSDTNYSQVPLSNVPITNDYLNYSLLGTGPYGNNGKAFLFTTGQKLKTNYLYSLSLYACNNTNFNTVSASVYAGVNANYIWGTNLVYSTTQPVYMSQNYSQNPNTNYYITACEMFTSLFVPSVDSNYVAYKLKMTSGNPTETYFLGYNIKELGIYDVSLTNQIQSIINNSGFATSSSVQQVQSSVNQIEQEMADVDTSIQNQTATITNSDTTGANNQADSIINNAAFSDTSGIQTIINAPLNFIRGLGTTCQPISLQVPYLKNTTLTIPCIKTELNNHIPTLANWIRAVINGFIVYRILLDIVHIIHSSRNPDDDRLEVLDL